MRLECDCYPGCWADHSKGWPRLAIDTEEVWHTAVQLLPRGSFVRVDGHLRVSTPALMDVLLGEMGLDARRPMTFERFAAANRKRCEAADGFNHPLQSWTPSDWMTATVGEIGEAANIIKKLNRVRDGIVGNKETEAQLRAKLRREIGDAFVYLDLTAQSLDIDLAAAAVEVFNAKSEEIGYPIRL